MTLEELREYFQNDQQSFKELQEKAARRRDQEVESEVDMLKKERQILKLQKVKDDQELAELMQVLDTKKEKELRAKIEKDKIAAELQILDRNKLGFMEEEKKRELNRLAAEREAIRKKEEDIMNEISNLSTKVKEKEAQLARDKEELLKNKNQDIIKRDELRKKEADYAKERAIQIAEIKHRREMLEQEKNNIAKDMEIIKSGDPEATKKLKNKASYYAHTEKTDIDFSGMDPEKKQKLLEEKARIEKLREEIRKTKAEILPDIAGVDAMSEMYKGKDLPRMTNEYISNIMEKNQNNPKKLYQELGAVREALDKEVKPIISGGVTPGPVDPLKNAELRTPVVGGLSQIPGYASQNFKKETTKLPNTKSKLKPAVRASQLPVPQDENLEGDQTGSFLRPQNIITSSPIQSMYNPYAMLNPAQANQAAQQAIPPIGDPILMMSLMDIKDKINRTFEKNKNLETELKKLKEGKSEITPKSGTKSAIQPPTKKLIDLPMPNGSQFAQNEQRADDLVGEEKALLNIAAQEYDALQMLSGLDPETELYQYKLKQYKEMSGYRAEMEKALQRQRLERLRFDFQVQKKAALGTAVISNVPEELGTVESMKKEAIVNRLQKDYVAQYGESAVTSPWYDPSTGFNLGFDYALNLPPDVSKLQIVYGLFAAGVPVIDLQQAGPIMAKPDRDKASCTMSFNKNFKDIPATPDIQLIAQLQGFDRNNTMFDIGWTFVHLFDAANKLKYFDYRRFNTEK